MTNVVNAFLVNIVAIFSSKSHKQHLFFRLVPTRLHESFQLLTRVVPKRLHVDTFTPVDESVCFTYRISPFKTFEFFRSCVRCLWACHIYLDDAFHCQPTSTEHWQLDRPLTLAVTMAWSSPRMVTAGKRTGPASGFAFESTDCHVFFCFCGAARGGFNSTVGFTAVIMRGEGQVRHSLCLTTNRDGHRSGHQRRRVAERHVG